MSNQQSAVSDKRSVVSGQKKRRKMFAEPTEILVTPFKQETDREGITRVHSAVGNRLYETMQSGDHVLIVGPHEGLVDELGLPEEAATRLHNILYRRKLYNYTQVSSHPQEVFGAIQEFYALDVQKLVEAFYRFEQELSEPVRS